MVTTNYLDANLLHDIVTGNSVTVVLHFINTTPIDCYLKRQATVETATYGSQFVAARTATEQIMDLRNTLRYLSVPIMTKHTDLLLYHECTYTSTCIQQKTQHVLIPQSERSHCSQDPRFQLVFI